MIKPLQKQQCVSHEKEIGALTFYCIMLHVHRMTEVKNEISHEGISAHPYCLNI